MSHILRTVDDEVINFLTHFCKRKKNCTFTTAILKRKNVLCTLTLHLQFTTIGQFLLKLESAKKGKKENRPTYKQTMFGSGRSIRDD